MINKSNSTNWFNSEATLKPEAIRRHLSSSTLALQSIITLLLLLDRLEVSYYPTIHRVTVDKVFKLGFNLTPMLLILSAITITLLLTQRKTLTASIPILVSALLYPLIGWENSALLLSMLLIIGNLLSNRNLGEYVFWILTFSTGFELIALIHWMLLPIGLSPLKRLANLELALFYVFARLTPILAPPITFLWMVKPFIEVGLEKNGLEHDEGSIFLERHLLMLISSLILSIVVALYPYSPAINPRSEPVGVDVRWYIPWMEEVERNPSSAFKIAGGSRPLLLLSIYVVSKLLSIPTRDAVIYFPLLLNPLLTLSTYFLVYKASDDKNWASLSALLMALGIKMTVGMYSYFLTNNLGLILLYTSLGLLHKSLKNNTLTTLLYASAFGSLTLFVHPWTTTQYLAALTLLTLHLYLKEKDLKASTRLLIYLLIIATIDLLKMTLLRGIELYGSLASAPLKFMNPQTLWSYICVWVFRIIYGGFLSNNLLWLLAALGILLLDAQKTHELFLLLLLPPSSIYSLLAPQVMSRLIYNLPLSIYAAKALLTIQKSRMKTPLKKAIFVFTLTYMTVYLLRSLANLVLVVEE